MSALILKSGAFKAQQMFHTVLCGKRSLPHTTQSRYLRQEMQYSELT